MSPQKLTFLLLSSAKTMDRNSQTHKQWWAEIVCNKSCYFPKWDNHSWEKPRWYVYLCLTTVYHASRRDTAYEYHGIQSYNVLREARLWSWKYECGLRILHNVIQDSWWRCWRRNLYWKTLTCTKLFKTYKLFIVIHNTYEVSHNEAQYFLTVCLPYLIVL